MNPAIGSRTLDKPPEARVARLGGSAGAVASAKPVLTAGWAPPGMSVYSASTGNVAARSPASEYRTLTFTGTGRSYRSQAARMIAVCEALERYSWCNYHDSDFIIAAAADLGETALDMALVPRCSKRELAHASCPITPFSPHAPIRWARGVDLLEQHEIFVPAVMAHLTYRREYERFWIPISTGCAVHTSLSDALVNGICEVIERDAISLLWLQRLPLPLVEASHLSDSAAEMLDWCERRNIRSLLFDATTDVSVPTVFCLQLCDVTSELAQVAGCATDLDISRAADSALLECIGVRAYLAELPPPPRRYSSFAEPGDGAAVMARRARRQAFRFLIDDAGSRLPREPAPAWATGSGDEKLRVLLSLLRERGLTAVAVDITPRELDEAGFVAVQVQIPELQPMSLQPLAQFRAHRRLFDAPAAMGYRALPEGRLNRWPQPFS